MYFIPNIEMQNRKYHINQYKYESKGKVFLLNFIFEQINLKKISNTSKF